ncbi:MAG: quorum sensing histidine kinase QseC [Pasteurellaceae bacterium]|nr:quorum sensing histidine kinase QseC [Pasteurellaceae bacterium]
MNWMKSNSLRWRLMVVLSITAIAIWLVSTAVAWLQVRKEVNDVFDGQQVLFAQRLATSNLSTLLSEQYHSHQKSHQKYHFDDDALAFAIFTPQGEILLSDGRNGDRFIFQRNQGFSVSPIHNDDDLWRIFWLPVSGSELIVAVGQELDYREDLIEKMVFGQMWIWFASLPLLLGLMIWLISRELQPIRQVSEQMSNRSPEDHSAISTQHLPKEILPLVNELNRFFERTSTMLLRERRFTSDAAHELRSPLAALKIQTEIAQLAGDDEALREKALGNLTQGIDRATQLIEQLLTLSRLDNLQQLEGVEPIDWQQLISSLIGERYFHAQKRQIELVFEPLATPKVRQGQPLLLSLLMRNLIDNAIKYCPEGSTVTIRLNADSITVQDNGGGVDESDLAKLGQRFYRPAGQNEKGSGLGLSIAHRIAELHHYQLRLENAVDAQGKKGLKATLSW